MFEIIMGGVQSDRIAAVATWAEDWCKICDYYQERC